MLLEPQKPTYRILLVEDEEGARFNLREAMSLSAGMDAELIVDECSTVEEAKAYLSSETFYHVAVVDIWLEDEESGGVEVVRTACASNALIEVIVVTSYEKLEYANDSLNKGARQYLCKGHKEYIDIVGPHILRAANSAYMRQQIDCEIQEFQKFISEVRVKMFELQKAADLSESTKKEIADIVRTIDRGLG